MSHTESKTVAFAVIAVNLSFFTKTPYMALIRGGGLVIMIAIPNGIQKQKTS